MRRFVMNTSLAFVLAWSAYASGSPVPAAEALTRSVDRFELEQRVLQLMIEEYTLRRRQATLWKTIDEEIDPETYARFFKGYGIHTGIYVDQDSMRVTNVVPGSPGHAAGLREHDRVLEINDTVGGDAGDAGARLFWAFRRMNPGDLVSVTFLRDDERRTVQVPVISQKQMQQIQTRESGVTELLSETEIREREREYRILRRQRHGVRAAVGEDRLGVWDGLLLISVAGGLRERLDTHVGVLVLESVDPDHPLRAGDLLTQVGHNRPSDAQHAVQLLYDYEDQPLIPLSVERAGAWLEVELPYPASERMR
ncbi:MAG: PDZ domain-containing protein [Gammaproteobacteria bacterium]|nr:PDZ domain-containing protein [Gammaproteobacteria bacterium]